MSVSGGHQNTKMKKYARILDFLQAHYKDVYTLFDELGMQGALTPFRGQGITLLLPDAKTIAKLQKIVLSESPEEATDYLDALILKSHYGTAPEFLKAKGTIANRGGNTLLVKAVNGPKVIVEGEEGDAELTVVEKFRGFDRIGKGPREKMAVWQLKGMPKLKTPLAPAPAKQGGRKQGGAEVESAAPNASAALVAWRQELLAKKLKYVAEGKHSEQDGKVECPLLFAVCQVLKVWEEQRKEDYAARACYYKARCLLTHNPCIDFFLLFFNPLVFPAEQLLHAKSAASAVGGAASFLKEFCDKDVPEKEEQELNEELHLTTSSDGVKGGTKSGAARSLVLHREGLAQLQEARSTLVERIAGNHTKALAETLAAYKRLDEQNSIGDAAPAFSLVLASCYRQHPGLSLLIDEAVWWLDTQLRACQALPLTEQAKFCADMFRSWDEVYEDLSFDSKKCILLNPAKYSLGEGREFVSTCLAPFIKAYMLRVPCSSEVVHNAVSGGDEDDEDVWDPASSAAIAVGASHMGGLEHFTDSKIRVSAGALRQMRAYMAEHGGKLPPELQ